MAKIDLGKIVNTAATGRVPYNYVVGAKDTGKGLPFDVKLSIDPDFKNTLIKGVSIFSGGVALGIIAGFAIKKARK